MRKALLVNWDCYPNVAMGGVYTWEKALIEGMPDWEFAIFNQLSNSNSNGAYRLPKNVTTVIEVPLYGSNRCEEFVRGGSGSMVDRILSASNRVVEREFLPLFAQFVDEIISDRCDVAKVSTLVLQLHEFFMTADSKKCLENPLVWDTFLKKLRADPVYREMRLNEALLVYQFLQRNLQILSIRLPKVDLVHCSLVWTPSLLGVISRAESGSPMIVTEHGVALRELLLYYNGYTYDEASKVLMKVIATNLVKTVYHNADVVAPVCSANTEWEMNLGVEQRKVKVIYNGIDTERFKPTPVVRGTDRPTIVSIGRIEIFKDIGNLLQAVRYAKEEIPDILCLIYGESIDLEYSLRCVESVRALGLEDNVSFMGGTKQPEKAYNAGDVVVVSSLTEGFPFSVIEAMSCGKPVVATDVGGVGEAIAGCGILVKSRNSTALGRSIVALLKDQQLRKTLGGNASKTVREKFTLSACVSQYKRLYEDLLESRGRWELSEAPTVQSPELVVKA